MTMTTINRAGRRFYDHRPGRVVVLCYHSVHPAKLFASATPELFALQLEWLKRHCEVVPFRQTTEAAASSRTSRPVVAVTFDDGYADNYEYAFPLLQKYGVPATFFLTVGLIEKDPAVLERFQWLQRSAYEDIRPLDWLQIREMAKAGMEFGAHTYSHPNLARLRLTDAYTELWRSKEMVEEQLGMNVPTMAYPFGIPRRHFTSETVELAVAVGYEYAGAIVYRAVRPPVSRLQVPRFAITMDNLETFRGKIFGLWDFMGVWQEKAPMWATRLLSPEC